MKSIFTLSIGLLFCTITTLHSQSQVYIFQPDSGLNNGSDQGGLSSGKDAWVTDGSPTTNYGSYPYIVALPISNCNSTTCIGFIQFDVSSLPAVVDSVVVGFTHVPHTNYCLSNCNADFYFARITQPWNEMTIDYTNQPPHDTAFYGPINVSFPNSFGVREYNITSTYLLWKTGAVPNNGFTIYSTTVGCNNAAVFFEPHSSDDTGAARPYLKIYTSGSGVVSPLAQSLNFSLSPNPAPEQATLRFTLGANGHAAFRITDLAGRLVMEEINVEGEGEHTIPLSLAALMQGMYLYTLETDQGTISGKLQH